MKTTLIWALIFIFIVPVEVFSQRRGSKRVRILVVDLSVPRSEVDKRSSLRASVFQSVQEHPRAISISDSQIAQWQARRQRGKKRKPASEDIREARELLGEGKEAYQSLKFDRAEDLLLQARREFILNLPSLRSNRDLVEAHLYLGMTYLALKKSKKAKDEFHRVVYLDPKRELSGRDFSPVVLEAFSKARQKIMEQESIMVQMETTPPGAVAYLNGRSLGKTPLKLDLQPGEYFILFTKPGMESWYKPIELKKRLETVRAKLKPDIEDLQWSHLFRVREGADRRTRDFGPIMDLASFVDADFVFLGTLTKLKQYRFLGQLLDARTSALSQVAVVTVGGTLRSFPSASADLVETLLGFVTGEGRLMSAGRPDLGLPGQELTVGGQDRPRKTAISISPAPKKKWYELWWIYPILVGAGVGIFFGAREIGGSGGSKIVIDNKGNF